MRDYFLAFLGLIIVACGLATLCYVKYRAEDPDHCTKWRMHCLATCHEHCVEWDAGRTP